MKDTNNLTNSYIKQIAIDIDNLIDTESKWSRGNNAVDVNGTPCIPNHPKAVAWCLMGAVQKLHPGNQHQFNWEFGTFLLSKDIKSPVYRWNDKQTYQSFKQTLKEFIND